MIPQFNKNDPVFTLFGYRHKIYTNDIFTQEYEVSECVEEELYNGRCVVKFESLYGAELRGIIILEGIQPGID